MEFCAEVIWRVLATWTMERIVLQLVIKITSSSNPGSLAAKGRCRRPWLLPASVRRRCVWESRPFLLPSMTYLLIYLALF